MENMLIGEDFRFRNLITVDMERAEIKIRFQRSRCCMLPPGALEEVV